MEQSLFTQHLLSFIKSHGLSEDLPSRFRKLQEEIKELEEAILAGDMQEITKEAADVAIIAFHVMLICGASHPLWIMFRKLEEVASRPHYQLRAQKVKEAENVKS